MIKTILGVFNDRDTVSDVIAELKEHGFNPKDVSIVMKDNQVAEDVATDVGASNVVTDTATGVSAGAVIGGLAGLLAAYAIPGLGAFFIGGPIAAALGLGGAAAATASGAVTGAAAGGIIGALTSTFGMSRDEARVYETSINEGAILVAVPAKGDDIDTAYEILDEAGADNIKSINMPERDYDDERRHVRAHRHAHA